MPSVNRRHVLGFGLAGVGAVALGGAPASAAVSTAPDSASEPLLVYDLAGLHDLDLADPTQARRAYDELHFVATLQGIVNRSHPRLYVHFLNHNEFGDIDIDAYWLDVLQERGGLLDGREIRQVASLDELVSTFRPLLRGAVVWDPAVPATSNVASTVAGARDVVAIRYDRTEGSLFQRYVDGSGKLRLPVKVWLIQPDGSPLFTGQGTIPDTDRATTRSPKCDAYLWAVEQYLRSGESVPEFAYYLDAYWLNDPKGQLPQTLLTNHDYLVSRRGFFFDLLPWDDETPVDDRAQEVGTDQRTLEEILRVGHQRSGGTFVPVHGFVPWQYKYTSVGNAGGHDPVPTEWRFVQVISAFNAYADADAETLDGMANASVFRHARLRSHYPQGPRPTADELRARGFLDADGGVVPRRYVMLYVGDYDSAAWIYQTTPYLWDDPARGSVPLNWAFNPNLAARMPVAMDRVRRTATEKDTFIAGDSGAGYINPGMLTEPREFSGLPSGVAAWREHCRAHYQRWDLSVTGFIIDGFAPPMDEATLQAYADFSPDGFAAQKVPPLGLVGETPYVRMRGDLPRGTVAEGAAAFRGYLDGDVAAPPFVPEFHSMRTILMSPSWHRDVVAAVRAEIPEAGVEVVDAHTFYALVRHYLLDQVLLTPLLTVAAREGGASTLLFEATSYLRTPVTATLALELPAGWSVEPDEREFSVGPDETVRVSVEVTVPADTPLGEHTVTAVLRYEGQTRRRTFVTTVVERSYADAAEVDVVLGQQNQPRGLDLVEQADGQTTPDTVAERECRRPLFTQWESSYFYLRVDDTFLFDARDTSAFVSVEYFDAPDLSFSLHYDSNDPTGAVEGAYTDGGARQTAGTNAWVSTTFELPDVRFANRQNGGADLRLATTDDLCVARVAVSRTRPDQP
ncbi:NEW3 domain-containing protein [Actinopolymorpha sp. B17G11]|uniref:NEW3 domain-containing protein n=1 Tax=Actinopolymorpha sp. B17G11 TaxID=3160861 RepID=UPI0032E51E49